MTDHTDIPDDSIHDGQGTYDVVLLVEQALTPADAKQVRSLHAEIEDPVVYHVLLPLEDAAARIEASLGTLGAGDLMAAPALAMNDVDIEALRRECEENSSSDLQQDAPRAARRRRDGAPARSRPSRRSTRSPRSSPRSTRARRSS